MISKAAGSDCVEVEVSQDKHSSSVRINWARRV